MIKKCLFDTYNGSDVYLYTLCGNNLSVGITDFGAAIQFLKVTTPKGEVDICLGYNTIKERINSGTYCGATIGRTSNRIGGAKFSLNGKQYILLANDGKNQNHGGSEGFSHRMWQSEVCGNVLRLTLQSESGDQGFPHKLIMTVEYEIVNCALEIRYFATADGDTLWAPTNHAYFNLDGESCKDISATQLKINANKYTILNEEHISTGEVASVYNTPFDFTNFKAIGADICAENEQLKLACGYDCNYILNCELAAIAKSEKSGIQLSVYTNLPALQFYTGNYLNGIGKSGEYSKRQGFCLEPQYIPNAVNIAHFKTPLIKKGEAKTHYIRFEFKIK